MNKKPRLLYAGDFAAQNNTHNMNAPERNVRHDAHNKNSSEISTIYMR
jgi:hypothetical protein